MEDGHILHGFYKKKVSSKFVTMARSALPSKDKRAILTAEAFRRLMNCHHSLSDDSKAYFLSAFCHSMAISGHEESFRNTVNRKAVGKYFGAWERK